MPEGLASEMFRFQTLPWIPLFVSNPTSVEEIGDAVHPLAEDWTQREDKDSEIYSKRARGSVDQRKGTHKGIKEAWDGS